MYENSGEASLNVSTETEIGLSRMTSVVLCQANGTHALHLNETGQDEDIVQLKYVTYGILLPTMCALGIVGNILNLLVLNQPNMKGTAYIYMRGYSSAALMAIIVAIPFAVRILVHHEVGQWTNFTQAFFHTYLELYLGNSCLGIGVMMLVALTIERFVAVCQFEKSRALQGARKAYITVFSIPVCTLLIYAPHLFRAQLVECINPTGILIYQKSENRAYLQSIVYRMYTWALAIVFRLGPTLLLAYLNLRIMVAYRRTCSNRRRMTGKISGDDKRRFAEESRIMMLLGSTSVLFFICVTPMVILSVMISEPLLKSFSFQVFRAMANLLEVTNNCLTFYIYCLFSREFRNTFLSLFQSKVKKGLMVPRGGTAVRRSGLKSPSERTPRGVESTPVDGAGTTVGGTTPLL